MANQYLALSLFIMLLSFFIILNSMSSYDLSKSAPVLNSLKTAFSTREAVDITPPGLAVDKTENNNLGSALDRIEGLFKSQIAGVQSKQNRFGTVMYMRLPFADFQASLTRTLDGVAAAPAARGGDQVNLLPLLVTLMETQRDVTYKMDMILNIATEPSTIMAENAEVFMNENFALSKIADRLEDAGLPSKQMTIGLKSGEEGMIDLVFSHYAPFDPLAFIDKSEALP